MTKLEELKAAWDAAKSKLNAADADCMNALKAYIAELDKQEENE